MNTLTEENYLKAIYSLHVEFNGEAVNTNAIAARVNTKAASVTDMLKKLAKKKLINYERYQGVTLTKNGHKEAVYLVRKHRLWEVFLAEKLEFKWDEVHAIAEQLEHIQSYELIEKLDKYLGWPKVDPHGDPIPDVKGKIKVVEVKALTEYDSNAKLRFSGVAEHSSLFLQFLDKCGLKIGDKLHVLAKNPYDNSLEVKINSKKSVFFSNEVAKNLLVSVIK